MHHITFKQKTAYSLNAESGRWRIFRVMLNDWAAVNSATGKSRDGYISLNNAIKHLTQDTEIFNLDVSFSWDVVKGEALVGRVIYDKYSGTFIYTENGSSFSKTFDSFNQLKAWANSGGI